MRQPVKFFVFQRIDLRKTFQLRKLRFRLEFRKEFLFGIQARIQKLTVIVKMINAKQQVS